MNPSAKRRWPHPRLRQSGALEVRVEGLGRDTAFGRIIEAVERAEKSRAPIHRSLLHEKNIVVNPCSIDTDQSSEILVARGGRLLGLLQVADVLRPEAKQAVFAIRQMGIRTVLLTGDAETIARAVSQELGVDEVGAELLPEQKLDRINDLISEGKKVAMIGDGINLNSARLLPGATASNDSFRQVDCKLRRPVDFAGPAAERRRCSLVHSFDKKCHSLKFERAKKQPIRQLIERKRNTKS